MKYEYRRRPGKNIKRNPSKCRGKNLVKANPRKNQKAKMK